ncbi:MAG TPA: cyclophane-forming radical SAM/SPASM peptide maturase GrrM/OscB [Stellaceae bacterium]|nr:cyclophane-forming radical SAM/SPASM peptide maturase GrrM/OscB [Stellaceae bacterium]
MPRIQLVVVQPTPFCNIDCRYCYLPDRGNKAVVADATLANLFSEVFQSGWAADGLTIVWHAGEPLVLPIDFYRRAFALIDRLKPPELILAHAFQTNGTLIDDAWCRFFQEQRVGVGVSIDGPRRLHDLNRVTRGGRGTFDKTLAGIRALRRNNVPFHVISVLSAESLAAPREMFEFYRAEGIEQVCFNVEESEGGHVSRAFAQAGIADSYYRFLREFWRLAAAAPGAFSFIREIDEATRLVVRPEEAVYFNQMVEPFAILSMDWSGNVATFSPELLGLKNAEYGDFIIGNVNRDRLLDMADRPALHRMLADIGAGVELCRQGCQYFSVCGGGEPVNKLSENGCFASAETTYCRMTKMRATDLVLDLLDEIGERLDPAAPDRAAARPQPSQHALATGGGG